MVPSIFMAKNTFCWVSAWCRVVALLVTVLLFFQHRRSSAPADSRFISSVVAASLSCTRTCFGMFVEHAEERDSIEIHTLSLLSSRGTAREEGIVGQWYTV